MSQYRSSTVDAYGVWTYQDPLIYNAVEVHDDWKHRELVLRLDPFIKMYVDELDKEIWANKPICTPDIFGEQEQEEELDVLASEDDVSVSFQHLFGEAQIEYTTDVEPATDEIAEGITEENSATESDDKLKLDEIDEDATEKESKPEITEAIEPKDDDYDVFEAVDEDVGLEHDFSFKDIWEDDTTQTEGDSEYKDYIHEEQKEPESIEDNLDHSITTETIETEDFDNTDAFNDDLVLEEETDFIAETDALIIDEIDVKDYFDYDETEDSIDIA